MSRATGIGARRGLPVNAQDHPDPAIRNAYWAEVQTVRRERRFANAQRGKSRCAWSFGQMSCDAILEMHVDRLGRTFTICRMCERRKAGVCRRCPRRVDGAVGRSVWCKHCRHPAKLERRRQREAAKGEAHRAARAKAQRDRRARIREQGVA